MICPKCKSEYKKGIKTCVDCNVPLVDKLAGETPKEYIKYKELLFTYNLADAAFLKSLFDANKIRYHIKGETFLQLRRLIQPVGILVDKEQFEEAKELIKPFKARFTGLAIDKDKEITP